jgi:hypothetical protein
MSRLERWFEFTFAYALAIVSAATASLYGIMSAAGVFGYVKGAGLCGIAFLGCHGLAWMQKAYRRTGWIGGLFGALVTVVCLSATLWGGLGTNASGGAALRAERTKVITSSKDDQATLERLTTERAAMHFAPATQDAVVAARAAVAAGENAKAQECGNGRGKFCHAREADEIAARSALSAALADASATESAAKLDRDIANVRARLDALPAAVEADPQASAFSALTGIPTGTAAALYAFWISLAFELGAMFALLIAYSGQPPPEVMKTYRVRVEEALPPARRFQAMDLRALASPAKARADSEDVTRFMRACLPPAKGQKAEVEAIYQRFRGWCNDEGLEPMKPLEFAKTFKGCCERGRIRVRNDGDKGFFFLDVKLAS